MQTTRSRYPSIRTFASSVLLRSRAAPPESDLLVDKLRTLITRGNLTDALSLFYRSPPRCHSPQAYATLFHACARNGCLAQGRYLHHHMLYCSNTPQEIIVTNHLINMYAKCGQLGLARRIFDEMPERNVVSWTALVSGYAQQGKDHQCISLFSEMLVHCRPNEFAFSSVITCCELEFGKQAHGLALKMGWDASVYVGNALISMYSKIAGCFDEAINVFDGMLFRNVVSWNSVLAGFQFRKLGDQVVKVFRKMLGEGIGFDGATFVSVLSCLDDCFDDASAGVVLRYCFQLHCLCLKSGLLGKLEVITALVKAYSDLGGEIADCYRIFSETSACGDIVLWTSIITVIAEHEPAEALFLFRQMFREDLSPDSYTFSIVLKACAGLVTERHAMAVYCQVTKCGFERETALANALIHACARCGNIALSKQVFDEMRCRDLASWNSIIKAYALHGQALEALHLFSQMNIRPDSSTIVSLLSACSHAGLVEEGIQVFDSMTSTYGISPQLDHYTCMVDILGRSGRVVEAKELISKMPMEPDSVVWSALLASCRKHGNAELAKLASDKIKELNPGNSLGYVQISNIYCSGGSYKEAGIIRKEMEGSRVKKEPGLSWTEIENKVHEFASGGRRHPEIHPLCNKLDSLIRQLKEMGYIPETSLALHDTEEEHKEEQLHYHSEKLALAYALMNEGSLPYGGTVIRIMKNIRICVDCHNFMKLASALLKKEIIVRDSNRFHHFKHSLCSCNDYW